MPNEAANISDTESAQAHGEASPAPDSLDPRETAIDPFPRARVEALPLWCTACYGSGCNRCISVCPHGAITLDEKGPEINEEACTRCGLCAGICDAFALANITLSDLLGRAKRGWDNEGSVVFTCTEHLFAGLNPRNNVIVVPCLGALPPEFWAACMAEGMEIGIFRDPEYCATCTCAGALGEGLYAYALDTATTWMDGTVLKCDSIPENADFLTSLSRIDARDRRSLLTGLVNESKEVANGKHRKRNRTTTDEYFRRRDLMRAEGRIRAGRRAQRSIGTSTTLRKYPRQRILIEALEQNPQRAENIPRFISCTNHDLCDCSKTCIEHCPTHARQFNEESMSVSVNAQGCIACGACVAVCPHGACDFKETTAAVYLEKEN